MSKRILCLLIVAALLVAGCADLPSFTAMRGSGNRVTQTYDFSNFDKLSISHAFETEVTAGDRYSVEVTVDDNLVDRLRVEQRGDTVTIGLDPNIALSNATLRARVSMPGLTSLDASGASRVSLSGFQSSSNMRMDVSGASTVSGDLESGNLDADVSGGSTLRLQGQGDSLRAVASGASTADLSDFAVSDANVEASGASRINVNASGRLDAEASGASSVRYSGNPTLGRIDQSGAGSVTSK